MVEGRKVCNYGIYKSTKIEVVEKVGERNRERKRKQSCEDKVPGVNS